MVSNRTLPLAGLSLALVGLLTVLGSITVPSASWGGAVLTAGAVLLVVGAIALLGHWRRSRAARPTATPGWDTALTLQGLTLGMVVIGLFGIAASYAGFALLTWTGQDALFVGGGFLAIGAVMFADLRRRGWGRQRPRGAAKQ
jgi:hypothetical protein